YFTYLSSLMFLLIIPQTPRLSLFPYTTLFRSRHLNLIDICLSTQTNNLAGQVRTTGKLPLYLAAGRYILASNVGEAAIILDAEMLVDYQGTKDQNYPLRLSQRVLSVLDHPEKLECVARNIALAKTRFDYAILADRMKQILRAMAVPDASRAP